MLSTIERYKMHAKDMIDNYRTTEQNIQQRKGDADVMEKKIELLGLYKRKLMGECLESCSIEELHELETQLERSLRKIKHRKNHVLEDQITQLEDWERELRAENAFLLKQTSQIASTLEAVTQGECCLVDVETELYIGWPGRRTQQMLKG